MILRKPYAFLIKHFKLIHLIITLLFGYVLLRTTNIYNYLRNVVSNQLNRYDAMEYIDYSIIAFIILALVLCFVVNWLLKYKDKPRRIYKIIMGFYLILIIFFFLLFGYMNTFISTTLEQKTVMLYRDISLLTIGFQVIITGMMLVRGLGFDIKKFNFSSDMHELGISEADSEEVLVDLKIDTTDAMRSVRKKGREFGYFFKEFKLFIIPVITILGIIIIVNGYKFFNDKLKVYHENQYIGGNVGLIVKNSYYNINVDKEYVIINFEVIRNSATDILNINNMVLSVNNKKYYPDKTVCNKFNNLGTCYKKQYLKNESSNYILVYSLDELNLNKPYLIYNDSYDKQYKVKLKLKQLS